MVAVKVSQHPPRSITTSTTESGLHAFNYVAATRLTAPKRVPARDLMTTWCPCHAISRILGGVYPSRHSWFIVFLVTPIRIRRAEIN